MEDTHDITSALQRLDAALTTGAPVLKSTLRPPATEQDLQALHEATAPWPLPPDLVAYLRWHDGQSDASSIAWWPTLNAGVLTPAQYMTRNYQDFCSDGFMGPWPRGWLPLTQGGHYSIALELTAERPAILIDVGVDGRRLIAPSLAAMFHATADLAEKHALTATSGGPAATPDDPGLWEDSTASSAAVQSVISLRYAGAWQDWRAVEDEHGVIHSQDGYRHYLDDPAFHRSVGWS
ncbi:SMI1/KNR4 family protein [Kineococcus aurantiacus]|uniref:Knr4/Smi1-like domain-containing protein n=1 Tax=Kineococcus aurantiacus TaxID=37633 RepID=A0A7Y9J3C4_9ACTN|nr:hypothetical protein [Kineococcus aurantiacus]